MSPIYGGPSEKIETLTYAPGLQGGTDLEAATKTISNTSENAVADYTVSLTIPAPTDSRFTVNRIGVRLSVTLDSWGGGGAVLNYRLKRGGTSILTGTLFTASATGNILKAVDVTTPVIGAATAYELFLWNDAGTCVISEVTIWAGVGTTTSSGTGRTILTCTGQGWAQIGQSWTRVGTGAFNVQSCNLTAGSYGSDQLLTAVGVTTVQLSSFTNYVPVLLTNPNYHMVVSQSVTTDLVYLIKFNIFLGSSA